MTHTADDVKRFDAVIFDTPINPVVLNCVLAQDHDRIVSSLRAQLPEGMEHCTIKLATCEKCERHWLQPTNWVNHGCPHCERDSLREEVERLGKDARRYQWLRSEASGIHDIARRDPISNTGATCVTLLAGTELDAAIDSAMEKPE